MVLEEMFQYQKVSVKTLMCFSDSIFTLDLEFIKAYHKTVVFI